MPLFAERNGLTLVAVITAACFCCACSGSKDAAVENMLKGKGGPEGTASTDGHGDLQELNGMRARLTKTADNQISNLSTAEAQKARAKMNHAAEIFNKYPGGYDITGQHSAADIEYEKKTIADLMSNTSTSTISQGAQQLGQDTGLADDAAEAPSTGTVEVLISNK